MKRIIILICFSQLALIDSNKPEEQRRLLLQPYFHPPFDEMIKIDEREEKWKRSSLGVLKGFIKVTPPSGKCLTIDRGKRRKNFYVCKEKIVYFQLNDVNRFGKISWIIRTNDRDLGTEVSWRTPYRQGKIVDMGKPWPSPGRVVYIKECKVKKKSQRRQIRLVIFGEPKPWFISFPERELLVLQPNNPRNLYYQDAPNYAGFVKVDSGDALELRKESYRKVIRTANDLDDSAEHRGLEMRKKAKDFEKALNDPLRTLKKRKNTSRWQMAPRNAYTMNASHLSTDGQYHSNGMVGRCHYRYDGYRYDKNIGALECFDADRYKWVYIPLSCIKKSLPAAEKK